MLQRIPGLPCLPAVVAMAIIAEKIIAFQCHSASVQDELQLKRPLTITQIEMQYHSTGLPLCSIRSTILEKYNPTKRLKMRKAGYFV